MGKISDYFYLQHLNLHLVHIMSAGKMPQQAKS